MSIKDLEPLKSLLDFYINSVKSESIQSDNIKQLQSDVNQLQDLPLESNNLVAPLSVITESWNNSVTEISQKLNVEKDFLKLLLNNYLDLQRETQNADINQKLIYERMLKVYKEKLFGLKFDNSDADNNTIKLLLSLSINQLKDKIQKESGEEYYTNYNQSLSQKNTEILELRELYATESEADINRAAKRINYGFGLMFTGLPVFYTLYFLFRFAVLVAFPHLAVGIIVASILVPTFAFMFSGFWMLLTDSVRTTTNTQNSINQKNQELEIATDEILELLDSKADNLLEADEDELSELTQELVPEQPSMEKVTHGHNYDAGVVQSKLLFFNYTHKDPAISNGEIAQTNASFGK